MITLAHVSDLHFGTELPALADALRNDLQALTPTLVVISGDLTQRARGAQFRRAAAYLASLPQPQLVIPGNHDVPLYDILRRFLAPLARYRSYIARDLNPIFETAELFVAGLNTARSLTWKSGRISVKQMATLRRRLNDSRARYKVVVTHHPFIPPPIAGAQQARIDLVGRAARAFETLDAGGVDLLLAGHLHHGYSGDTRTQYPAAKRAIISAQAGSAISHRIREAHPNAYNLVTFEGEQLRLEIRAWNGERFAPSANARYERRADGWHAAADQAV